MHALPLHTHTHSHKRAQGLAHVLIHGSMSGSISAASALANLVANSNDNKVSVCNTEGVLPRLVELALGGAETDRLNGHIGERDKDKDPDKLNDSNSGKEDEPTGSAEPNGENGCERDEHDEGNGTLSSDYSQSNGHNDMNASTDDDKNRRQTSPHSGNGSEPSTPTARPGGRGLRFKGQEAAARAMLNLASNKEAANLLVATPNAVSALCELMLRGTK
jgi:hypothetical protein